jgi:hypothetical protein
LTTSYKGNYFFVFIRYKTQLFTVLNTITFVMQDGIYKCILI